MKKTEATISASFKFLSLSPLKTHLTISTSHHKQRDFGFDKKGKLQHTTLEKFGNNPKPSKLYENFFIGLGSNRTRSKTNIGVPNLGTLDDKVFPLEAIWVYRHN